MAYNNKESGKHIQNATWYFALIAILVAALIIWAISNLRVDLFTDALNGEEPVTVLIVIDDGEFPVLAETLIIDPRTFHGALVAIPKETGTLLGTLDRFDRLEVLYDTENTQAYSDAVGKLIGQTIHFTVRFDLASFERLVDLLWGLDVFIPNVVDEVVDGKRYLFPPGGVKLDGGKVHSYLCFTPNGEPLDARTSREHRIIQSLLRAIGKNIERLQSEDVFPYIVETVDATFDERALESFLKTVAGMDADHLVFQAILGNRRILDGRTILFPYYEGKLIKETVERIEETLQKERELGDDLLTVRVEVLNGTTLNGLASRTARVFQNYGFRVVSVKNADRDDYQKTVVLDRRGNPDAAQQVAEVIRCDRIHSHIDENRNETVDITLILGKDFDGRYVKK